MGDNTTNTVKSEIEVIEISDDAQATEEPEEIKQEIEETEELKKLFLPREEHHLDVVKAT